MNSSHRMLCGYLLLFSYRDAVSNYCYIQEFFFCCFSVNRKLFDVYLYYSLSEKKKLKSSLTKLNDIGFVNVSFLKPDMQFIC